ncbi:hypothetical protein HPB48_007160 [Haemaphysalis longicornis]|uniref:Uncharacterized protein n=1 Tax=Haemaphysalis longicornis TaxID=44386 RepID=A0A9J6GWC6_HAELO|nr:hypothetical protein HPB48_007160 [Haemaphysalis longicornis]
MGERLLAVRTNRTPKEPVTDLPAYAEGGGSRISEKIPRFVEVHVLPGKYLAAERICRTRYKVPYVVRKTQLERRKGPHQILVKCGLFHRRTSPQLERKSQSPSKNRYYSLKEAVKYIPHSRDPPWHIARKDPSGGHRVTWVDAARCPTAAANTDASVRTSYEA